MKSNLLETVPDAGPDGPLEEAARVAEAGGKGVG